MAPVSQELEPPAISGRFTVKGLDVVIELEVMSTVEPSDNGKGPYYLIGDNTFDAIDEETYPAPCRVA